jgi:tetratricopeptide (TPR) repeat protein
MARQQARGNLPTAHQALGAALLGAGRHEEAIPELREAIRLNPRLSSAYVGLGGSLALAGRPAEGLQVVTAALRQNPTWAGNPRNGLRYNAACLAIYCADGRGSDAPPPADRPAHRKQALELLTAELAAVRRLSATDRAFVHRMAGHWLANQDLASVRDPAQVAPLQPDERREWEKLWSEVRDLRDRTAPAPESE